jgi:hypothetical protein
MYTSDNSFDILRFSYRQIMGKRTMHWMDEFGPSPDERGWWNVLSSKLLISKYLRLDISCKRLEPKWYETISVEEGESIGLE